MVSLDTGAPFGAMSKTETPLALIKARNINSAPWVLGGQLEADLQYWNGSNIHTTNNTTYNNGSNVSLTKWYLFNQVNISKNAIGILSLKNSLPSYTVQIDRAFLMLGQLNTSQPLFVIAGYTYLPFGNFGANGPLDNNITTNMFRISPTDQVSLNAGTGHFTVIGTMFNNNSSVNNSINYLVTGLFNKTIEGYNLSAGNSYLTNIVGTNSGVGGAYHQAGSFSSTQPLQSATNPAWDINVSFGLAPLSIVGEYVTTLRSSTNQTQSVGKISAWMMGFTGKFAAVGTPYSWQLTYDKTRNMQNMPMPLDGDYAANLKTLTGYTYQWLGSIQGQYWKNVYLGPEISYGNLYNNTYAYTLTLDLTAYF